MSVLIVSGTGTGVGKTIVTAALAACASGRVAVVKPAQTGVRDGQPGDLAEVTRLSGITDVHEFARYPEPMSPHHAALRAGQEPLNLGDVAQRIRDLDREHDLVLVEGAGGLLVPFAPFPRAWSVLDIAVLVHAPVLIVTQPGLGTLNHTALTMTAIAASGAVAAGIVIGSWPDDPDTVARLNVGDLAAMSNDGVLAGVLPAGMAEMKDFPTHARAALAPQFGGTFDWPAFCDMQAAALTTGAQA